ncbi:MAG TPA: DUF4175 family protein [Gemmataceae bacterium]|nr:DUF4175 family protein [Gemmataceae bacterium]
MFRTTIGMVSGVLLALLGLSLFGPALRAAEAVPDLTTQEERQKQIQAETDRLVRRMETMIRVLQYNRLDKLAEKQLIDQVASTLNGLSREQMTHLIAALEKAGKAKGEARSQGLKEAQDRHEQIVLGLKGLLARFDAVKSLDQAAERLDKMARDELDQHLQNVQLAWEDKNRPSPQRDRESRQRADHLAGEQSFIHRDLSILLDQMAGLRKLLPPEQQESLRKMEGAAKSAQLLDNLVTASRHLRTVGAPAERHARWRNAADLQWQAAGDIQELARVLRGSTKKLEALREARQKVERAIEDQDIVRQSTLTPPEKEKPDVRPEDMPELNLQWARGLSSREAALEFDTRGLRALLQPHVKELADKLNPIEKTMREAQNALRDQATRRPPITEATKPQETAAARLREVKTELDRLITETETAQADPLANLKDTLAKVEQIIKEQKDVRDKTDEAEKTAQTQRLPFMAPKQEDLAKRTEEIQQQPTAAKTETKKALDNATKAMEEATKTLKDKQAPETVKKQDKALDKLEEAKKALTEQVAEIEKRRDDIAKLEEADRKLEEMIKQENKVAEETHDKAKKPDAADAKDLAKKQGELTPQAKELGKELEKSVPDAAKHVDEGAKKMDAAKNDLDKKQLPPAAKNAEKAVEKLKDAQKAVAKALDEKKGMEAAEQAAMQPEVDPMNAAQQIAKALEQTEQAAKDSEKATEQLGKKPQEANPDLAKLQKEVAKQAEKVDAPAAKEPARDAAEALKKGDLKEALAQQKKALAQLQDAAQKKGEQGEATPNGAPMPAEAKNAGELAQAQKALMEATKALAKSQAANQAAMAALAQAQAQAPGVVKPQLQKAGEQLAKAGEKLQQGEAKPANQSQEQAAAQLKKALDTLNSATAQAGEKGEGEGQKPGEGEGKGEEGQGQGKEGQGKGKEGQGKGKGEGQGQKPGEGQGQGKGKGKGKEKNEGRGNGDRIANGQANNGPSQLGDLRGDGLFIHLPPRQRELIKQALSDKLPPEYAALIQQYYINIARGKPAMTPAKPKP